MKRFDFRAKVGGFMDRCFDLTKKVTDKCITIDSYKYMSADELEMVQDGLKLVDDGRELLDDLMRHYDDLEEELEQAKRDREKMIRMLEELKEKTK